MGLRAIALPLALVLLAAPLVAEAQQAAKVPRIGYLAGNLAGTPHLPEAFRQGLRDLGYVEGRNVVIEYRDAEGKLERLPALAAELVALKIAATEAAAATLKVGLHLLDVRAPDDLPKAFDTITRQRADALLVLPDAVSLAHRKPILAFAASRRLPAMYPFREMVDEGGLMCYGPNLVATFRAVAGYVDKILKGATVGDLPIPQATNFDLVINLKTAKALGLTIPPALLLRGRIMIE